NERQEFANERLAQDFGRLTEPAGLVAQVHAEQRLAGNLQGQLRHLLVEIDRRAGAPAVEPAPRQLNHHRGIAAEPAVVEGLLNQPPLLEPEIALAVDQALAVDLAKDPLLPLPLAEAFPLGDEDLTNEARAIDQVAVNGAGVNVDDVAVPLSHL